MNMVRSVAVAVMCVCAPMAAQAQVPHIVGTWEFNAGASRFAGPPPQTHVREYRPAEDGVLVGIAVIVEADGRPRFLQFAAKPDGMDYPEFDNIASAQYLIDGSLPVRTYSETPIDEYRVRWVDKRDGALLFQGDRWVSEDGQTMSFTVERTNEDGEPVEDLYVFDRTGE
jgi:hypothetical protein